MYVFSPMGDVRNAFCNYLALGHEIAYHLLVRSTSLEMLELFLNKFGNFVCLFVEEFFDGFPKRIGRRFG